MIELGKIPYLNQDLSFKQIGVFKVNDYYPHAYFEKKGEKITLERESGAKYVGEMLSPKKLTKVIFSETYDPAWRLKAPMQNVQSQKYMNSFNSFIVLPGTTRVEIIYEAQIWVQVGIVFSLLTFVILIIFIVLKKEK